MAGAFEPIPSPPGLPLIGNISDFASGDPELRLDTIWRWHDTYGPIYRFNIAGRSIVAVGSVELMDEVCHKGKFEKMVTGPIQELRVGIKDGLFTAHTEEENWGKAHRILMPAFGPMAIREMFDEMHDIASQLVLKWARMGPDYKIPAADDFTRLTLDTLALCAMDFRFNSFYGENMHPFVGAMVRFLAECGHRSNRPVIATMLMRRSAAQLDADVQLQRSVADEIVAYRRAHPSEKKDLLNAMLNGRDPKTGEGLDDENIASNMITLLIAGHETTSGLLSFTFMYLLQNSNAYRRAQQEVDEVVGRNPITVDHIPKFHYLAAVLREALRLQPTAPAFNSYAKRDGPEGPVTLGGKYLVGRDEPVLAVLSKVQRDPKVYGDDAEEFKPERMLDENFENLPKAAWKPFGTGVRGCIGRPFAWQEALLVTAILLQNFNFQLDDPSYKLKIKQTLTLKPKDFFMRATLREGIDPIHLERNLKSNTSSAGETSKHVKTNVTAGATTDGTALKPMSIFFGGNTGTCESLAQRLASDAVAHGFEASISPLDGATEKLPKDQASVIITASYEGQAPDNATHFVEWLSSLKGKELEGTSYAVFGCGHRDWKSTYQRIPKVVDDAMEERGAERIVQRGLADASTGNMFNDFDTWEDELFWPEVEKKYGGRGAGDSLEPLVDVEISSQARSTVLRQDVSEGLVIGAKVLTAPGEPEKRHIDIQLPSSSTYRAGDYLAILPINPHANVRRVMKRFQLPWDAVMKIKAKGPTVLPVSDNAVSVNDVLSAYVELAQPATKKNIQALARATTDDSTKTQLETLAVKDFEVEITQKRISVLDLLERFSEINLPFGEFLASLPPMRVRQYSISSSPLINPTQCSITFSLLDQPHMSGEGDFVGVASSYLRQLQPGDKIQVSVRPSHKAFHLPLDPTETPVIMIGSGTGIAPFRGFVQERAAQIAAGRKLAPATLFVGCRTQEMDRLYAEEVDAWAEMGAVDLRYAFSKQSDKSCGCRYVQDRLYHDRKEMVQGFKGGAKIFVCGGRPAGAAVEETIKKICQEKAKEDGKDLTQEELNKWLTSIRNERFATDVFS